MTERCRTITEFAEALEYFFRAPESYDEKATKKFVGTPEQAAQLRESGRVLAAAWDTAPKPAPDEIAAWGAAMEGAASYMGGREGHQVRQCGAADPAGGDGPHGVAAAVRCAVASREE